MPSILKALLEVWDIRPGRLLRGNEGSPLVQEAPKARFLFPGISSSQGHRQVAYTHQFGVSARDLAPRERGIENRGHLRAPPLGNWPSVSANWGQIWQWGLESNSSAGSIQEWPELLASMAASLGLGPFLSNPLVECLRESIFL